MNPTWGEKLKDMTNILEGIPNPDGTPSVQGISRKSLLTLLPAAFLHPFPLYWPY